MYVLSAGNRRVSVQLLGEDKIQEKVSRLDELKSASVAYLGVSSVGDTVGIASILPSKFERVCTFSYVLNLEQVGLYISSHLNRSPVFTIQSLFHLQLITHNKVNETG